MTEVDLMEVLLHDAGNTVPHVHFFHKGFVVLDPGDGKPRLKSEMTPAESEIACNIVKAECLKRIIGAIENQTLVVDGVRSEVGQRIMTMIEGDWNDPQNIADALSLLNRN